MGTVTDYAEIVKRVIRDYADLFPREEGLDVELVFDDAAGHYELLYVGWEGEERVHGCVAHVDVRDGKIWIQHDGTEDGLATELVAAGVPKEAIVLAFHPPYKRPFTGYAVT